MLKDLLDEDSNILAFQNMFDIVSVDYESIKFMKWVFPGYENINGKLPEETTLQRRMKNALTKILQQIKASDNPFQDLLNKKAELENQLHNIIQL